MAGYYDNSSLLSGSNTPQFDVGALLKGGAAIQQSLGGIRERELEDAKVARDAKRFAREQELNTRADTEYNREIGLRSTRQDLSKEFLTNPYAAKFGSGKETALLDQQVNDYVSKGGVIDDDMAKRLQARYEEAKPFREDAANALTSQMILAGEDPTKAAQVGAALGSNLLSRVEQQAAVSANRKIEQDQYDEAAKRNKEALQLKLDISKANQAGDKDKAELLFKQFQAIGGGGTGGSGTASTGLMDTLSKIGPIDAKSALAEGGPIDLARKAGFTEAQIAKAAGQSLDTDPTAWTWADNKLDTTMFSRNLGMQTPGAGLSKSINIRDIQAPTAEEWASIVPDRAGYRVVDYDPKKFLDNSKSVLPELFGKDADKPLLSDASKMADSNPNVPLDRGGKSVLQVKGVPDSLVLNEGLKTDKDGMFRAYTDNNAKGENKGFAIAGGYNYSNKSPEEIRTDFNKAGIGEAQIKAAIDKQPIKISEQQGKDLFAVGYKRIGEEKASKILPEYKTMNPLMKEIAADMAYRGDLVAGSDGYQGDLVKVLKTGDVNKVYDYVNNTNVPIEVKQRLGNILTVDRDASWYEGGTKKTEAEVPKNVEIPMAVDNKSVIANLFTNASKDQEMKLLSEASEKSKDMSTSEFLSQTPTKLTGSAGNATTNGLLTFIDNNKGKMLPQLLKDTLNRSASDSLIEQDIRQERIAEKVKNKEPLSSLEQDWINRMKNTKANLDKLKELGIIK